MISPAIAAIGIAVLAAVAFGGGFALNGWRLDGQIARLTSNNAVLSAANDKCATDIQTARAAMAAMHAAAAAREAGAEWEMQKAQPEADEHIAKAKTIKTKAPVPPDAQCETIKREQILYVESRAD